MQTLEDRIRSRAYEIWERAGCTGDPEDHWRQAEQELAAGEESMTGEGDTASPDAAAPESDATVDDVQPAAAVEAAASVGAAGGEVAAEDAAPAAIPAKRSRGKRAS
jgi:hypothetical protein